MAIELPAAPKVYTHVYDNFKGVDFTNDATNVWHRRSPDGVNMLPDDSGRPFKRTGWEILLSQDDLTMSLSWNAVVVNPNNWSGHETEYYTYDEETGFTQCQVGDAYDADTTYYQPLQSGVEDIEIFKCSYFELAGVDHVVIFTNFGVLFYNGDPNETKYITEGITAVDTDPDCYSSYDRAFFFEGDGTSAFYIYGSYKVWVYWYNDGFNFGEAEEVYIPTILFSTDPSTCTGELLEDYNLLGNKVKVQYQSNEMFYWYVTGDFTANIDKAKFDTWLAGLTPPITTNPNTTYVFTYDSTNTVWDMVATPHGGTAKTYSNITPANMSSTYGIDILDTPADGKEIVLKYCWGVLLPNNVAQAQKNDVKVERSFHTQFDDPLTVLAQTATPTNERECSLHSDEDSMPEESRRAWIEFYQSEVPLVDGEDAIRVFFPSTEVKVFNYPITGHEGDCDWLDKQANIIR